MPEVGGLVMIVRFNLLFLLILSGCSFDPAKVKTELEGVWSTDCIKVSEKGFKESVQFHYNQLRRETVYFNDEACLSISHVDLIHEEFEIRGQAKHLTDSKKINSKLLKMERTYHSTEAANIANERAVYSYSDWTALSAKPTHDRVLGQEDEKKTRNIHQVWHSIYHIAGNTLYLGDHFSKDGLSEENRAISLSGREYVRQ